MDKEVQVLKQGEQERGGCLENNVGQSRTLIAVSICLAGLAALALFMLSRAEEASDRPNRQRIARNRSIVAHAAKRLGVSVELALAVAAAESAFDDTAVSSAGAVGLMQVMPATGKEVVAQFALQSGDLNDPRDNALIGCLYLKEMLRRYRGDLHLALAAYNAGPGSVDRWIGEACGLPGPEIIGQFAYRETRQYVAEVTTRAQSALLASRVELRYAHTVEDGETLESIASDAGVSVTQILRLNGIDEDTTIQCGQCLWLRPVSGDDTAADARVPAATAAIDVEMLVEKAERRLQVVVRGVKLKQYRIGLGFDPKGDKQREGDGRTPEGVYYVCRRSRGRYGRSLGLSYPNTVDAARGLGERLIDRQEYDKIVQCMSVQRQPPWNTALGGAILIHGQGSGRDWTAGCIALDDDDANELFALTPMGARVAILP